MDRNDGLFNTSRIHLIVPSGSSLGVAGAADSPPNETGDANQRSSGSESAPHGLSLGAKVAIGAVIPVVFLALAALGLFFVLRYRKKRLGVGRQVETTPMNENSRIARYPGRTPQIQSQASQPLFLSGMIILHGLSNWERALPRLHAN